jgi:hypothetical protein
LFGVALKATLRKKGGVVGFCLTSAQRLSPRVGLAYGSLR